MIIVYWILIVLLVLFFVGSVCEALKYKSKEARLVDIILAVVLFFFIMILGGKV